MICPRCHQEVDRNAMECPHCGLRRRISPRKLKARRRRKNIRCFIGVLILLIPILLLTYYFGIYRPAHPRSPKPASPESSIQPPTSKEPTEPIEKPEPSNNSTENTNAENSEPPMEDALSFGQQIELTGTLHVNQWKHPEKGWSDFYVLDLEKRINIKGDGKNYSNISELQVVFTDLDPTQYNGHRVRIKGLLNAAEENSHYRRPMYIYNPEIETLD